jgi:AmiR/NasT family two-component response regulator
VSPQRADRLERLSLLVGRDPKIEEAKLVLRDRYDITGAQAFELLRHISQTKNRKLRDVARDVLASHPPGSADGHVAVPPSIARDA